MRRAAAAVAIAALLLAACGEAAPTADANRSISGGSLCAGM